MNKTTTKIGDIWHIFRVALAEHLLWIPMLAMPEGPEKNKLVESIASYARWAKENDNYGR